jgi:hypothetical protein
MLPDESLLALRLLSPDLRCAFLCRPRETLTGYVLAARILDKCRATLLGQNGAYNYACPLGALFLWRIASPRTCRGIARSMTISISTILRRGACKEGGRCHT